MVDWVSDWRKALGSGLGSDFEAETVVHVVGRKDHRLSDRFAHNEQIDRRMHSLAAESLAAALALEAGQELVEEQVCARTVLVPEAVEEAETLSARLENHLGAESESLALRDPHRHQDPQPIHSDPYYRTEPQPGLQHDLQASPQPLAVP